MASQPTHQRLTPITEGGEKMNNIHEMMEDPLVREALLDHYRHEAANSVDDDCDPDDREHPALTSDHPGRTGP